MELCKTANIYTQPPTFFFQLSAENSHRYDTQWRFVPIFQAARVKFPFLDSNSIPFLWKVDALFEFIREIAQWIREWILKWQGQNTQATEVEFDATIFRIKKVSIRPHGTPQKPTKRVDYPLEHCIIRFIGSQSTSYDVKASAVLDGSPNGGLDISTFNLAKLEEILTHSRLRYDPATEKIAYHFINRSNQERIVEVNDWQSFEAGIEQKWETGQRIIEFVVVFLTPKATFCFVADFDRSNEQVIK
jgi:hypothetical protein